MFLHKKIKKEVNAKLKSEQFGDKEDRAKQMYANAPVFKALLYVALPGILIAFMQGMFIFADQIMMVNLIPTAGTPNLTGLFGDYTTNIKNFIDCWNFVYRADYASQISTFSIDALIRLTVSLITPGLYILNAVTILVGMGTAVNFSKAISTRNKEAAYDAWSTGVISTIVISICSSCIIIGCAQAWVTSSVGSVNSVQVAKIFDNQLGGFQSTPYYHFLQEPRYIMENGHKVLNTMKFEYPAAKQDPSMFPKNTVVVSPLVPIHEEINDESVLVTPAMMLQHPYQYIYYPFYAQYRAKAIYWSSVYLRVDAGFNIFACFNQYFSLMIRAEGRQFYPAFLATLANALNIVLDAIFIDVVKMGVFGSVTALVTGWAFNVLLFIVYIAIMAHRKNVMTYLKFGKVRFRYFKWDIVWIAVGVGAGASIWNAGIAMQGTIQNITLTETTVLTKLPVSPSYYVELNGAMLPIVNFFFNVLYGTVQGGVALVAYSYGARRYDRVKKEFWMTLAIVVIYGLFIFLFIGWGIDEYMLDGFRVTEGIPDPENAYKFFVNARYFLRPTILEILTYSFATPALLLYQALGKMFSAVTVSGIQGFVFSFISLYVCQAIAVDMTANGNGQGGMDLFLFALAIDSSICAIISFTWSALYLKYRLGKPTRIQIDHICKRIMKIDFSLFNEAIDPAKSLPKAVVIVQK